MKLDFIIIGAQKAGTTSLWQYLRGHPRLFLPRSKEVPFFTQASVTAEKMRAGVRGLAAEAPSGSLLGKATPDYMVGGEVPVEVVAERIAAAFPDARLIALLRDPVERAVSSYMMAVRRAQEARPLDEAFERLLGSEELACARRYPTPTNTYIVAGEYGRMLSAYMRAFSADRLLVAFTHELDRDPGLVIDHVLSFLGLPTGYRPERLDIRHFQGGRRRLLSAEAEELLLEFYDEEIAPHLIGSPSSHRRAFEFFLETWNVRPDDERPSISPGVRARLEDHFARDAKTLSELGVEAPWIADWREIADR